MKRPPLRFPQESQAQYQRRVGDWCAEQLLLKSVATLDPDDLLKAQSANLRQAHANEVAALRQATGVSGFVLNEIEAHDPAGDGVVEDDDAEPGPQLAANPGQAASR